MGNIADKLVTITENEQKVYDAGKMAEREAFWRGYTENGARTDYDRAFNKNGWNDATFNPPFTIAPTKADEMFMSSEIADALYTDKLDLSQCTSTASLFEYCQSLRKLKTIDLRSSMSAYATFYDCICLESIDMFYPSSMEFDCDFDGCESLKSITFGFGSTIGNGLYLGDSPLLDKASIISVFTHLQLYPPQGYSCTLSKAAVDKAFETSPGANDGSTAGNSEYWNLMQYTIGWTIQLV